MKKIIISEQSFSIIEQLLREALIEIESRLDTEGKDPSMYAAVKKTWDELHSGGI